MSERPNLIQPQLPHDIPEMEDEYVYALCEDDINECYYYKPEDTE